MMKTIEKVANAILDKAMEIADRDEYSCISSARGKSDMDMGLALAQAAIQALDIIILPADAEPQVGDVITKEILETDGSFIFLSSEWVSKIDKDGTLYTKHLQAPRQFIGHQGGSYKIIQRNGKPVIQETTEGA